MTKVKDITRQYTNGECETGFNLNHNLTFTTSLNQT